MGWSVRMFEAAQASPFVGSNGLHVGVLDPLTAPQAAQEPNPECRDSLFDHLAFTNQDGHQCKCLDEATCRMLDTIAGGWHPLVRGWLAPHDDGQLWLGRRSSLISTHTHNEEDEAK